MSFSKLRRSKKSAAVLLVCAGGLSLLAASNGCAPSKPNPESADDQGGPTGYEQEFGAFVQEAIRINMASTQSAQWEQSGYTPEDLIANARARSDAPEAFRALCLSLEKLGDESLALFQNEIADPSIQSEMKCARGLAERLRIYWNSRRAALEAERVNTHTAMALSDAGATLGSSGGPDVPQLRSEEVHIDSSRGETIRGLPSEGYLHEGEIAITIDDGPHPQVTRKVLRTLKAFGVRANFFSVGRAAQNWPQLVRAELAAGHVTGSHTMTHPMLANKDMLTASREILGGRRAVAAASEVQVPFFRFPYGAHNEALDTLLKRHAMTSFLWNMDSEDWKRSNPSDLFHNQVAQLNHAKGGIILMHDTHEQTAIALPHLLDELHHRGWKTILFVVH